MDFTLLTQQINTLHKELKSYAASAVNQSLTIRNWLIGFYIVEYEQNGEDRVEYGSQLMKNISQNLYIKGLTASELSRCRQLYITYPQILGTVSQNFNQILPASIFGTVSQKLKSVENQLNKHQPSIDGERIIQNLSYSHLTELLKIDDTLKRTFYEVECIKGTWSVRELKRQRNCRIKTKRHE